MFVGDIRKFHIWSNLDDDIEASMQRPLLRENISSSDPFVLLLAIGTDAKDAKNTACLSSECPQIAVFGKVLPVFECLSLFCLIIRPFTNGHKN